MRNKLLASAIAAAALIGLATPAFATVTYDAALDDQGTYYGIGNANLHWTVDTESTGVQLGLQTVIRYTNAVTPVAGTSLYNVPLGDTTVGGKHGSAWGFAFSYNSGASGLTLSQITTSLSIFDVRTGQTVTFDPNVILTDNSKVSSPDGFQNAEALSFSNGGSSFFDPAYNSSLNDTYIVSFSAATSTASLGSVSETIVAGAGIPEPASLALLSAGLLGLRVIRRKTRSNTYRTTSDPAGI